MAATSNRSTACSSTGRDGKGGMDHCLGRFRGGLTTKIYAVAVAQAPPIWLGPAAGQAHDGQIADTLLDHLGPRFEAVGIEFVPEWRRPWRSSVSQSELTLSSPCNWIADPSIDVGFTPTGAIDAYLDLSRERAFGDLAIDG